MKPVRLLKVALEKLKKVVSVQTINTTGEYPLFRYCFHISSPGIITQEKEWYPHFRLYIGRFPHFLDIRQFIGKSRNVDTLLYREVSTFFRYTTIHGKAQKCGYFTI